jgi:uncharacterized protein involved in outer membrane biogenesis
VTRALPALAVLGLLVVGALLALILIDWNALKGPIAARVGERTGHTVAIGGELRVRVGRRLWIAAEEVRVTTAPAEGAREVFAAREVVGALSWLGLARGRIDLHELALVGPRVVLQRATRSGGAAAANPLADGRIRIRRLRVDEGTLEFTDPSTRTAVKVRLAAAGTDAPDDLKLDAAGTYHGAPFKATAAGPTVLTLARGDEPYRFAAEVRAGANRASVHGTVTGWSEGFDLDLVLTVAGSDLAEFGDLVGVKLGSTPPFRLGGRLRRTGPDWQFDDLAGRVGESDLAGRGAFSSRGRPSLRLELVSERLDFDDLGPLIGAPPRTVGEAASPRQRSEAARLKTRKQALPDKPLATDRWRNLDVEATLVGKRVLHPPALPVESLESRLRISDGVLTLEPL